MRASTVKWSCILSCDNDNEIKFIFWTCLVVVFRPGDCTYRVADELPWLIRQLDAKDQLNECVLDLCIFVKLYGRGRCSELIGYWQFLGVDKISMAQAYFKGVKRMEGMVGMFNGMVTLPRIADVYEALGRFLKDMNLLSEVQILNALLKSQHELEFSF